MSPDGPPLNRDGSSWAGRSRGSRVGFGVLLLTAMGLAATIQYAAAALAPFLVVEFGLTRTQIGTFTSMMFAVAAIVATPAGRLIDRIGTRVPLIVLFATGIVAAVALAAAPGYAGFLIAAAFAGLPMAIANPVTNQLVRQEVPAGQRGTLIGIKQSGVKFGQLLAGSLLPAIALMLGWRAAAGSILFVAVAGLIFALRVPSRVAITPARDSTVALLDRDTVVLVRLLAMYAFFMGAGQAAVGAYLPLYAFEEVGMSVTAAGVAASLMGASGIVARIGWARPAERARNVALPLGAISLGALVAIAVIALAAAGNPVLLVLGAMLFGATAPVWNVVAMLAVLRRVTSQATGRATAIVFIGFSGGFVVGPAVFGLLADTVGYGYGWLATAGTVMAGAAIAVLIRRHEH